MKAELTGWYNSTGSFTVNNDDGTLLATFSPTSIAWDYLKNGTFYEKAKQATEKVVDAINGYPGFLDDDLIASSGIKAGVSYQHFKGGVYVVVGFARSSEDPSSTLVLYRKPHGSPEIWARPIHMWFEQVSIGVTRFTEIKEGTA